MIIFWVRLFPKRHSRFLLSQLSMAALRAWRKSGQDVLVVGFFTWQPGVWRLASSPLPQVKPPRSASPGVNTRSVARLVRVPFLYTSALVHLPTYLSQVVPGKQADTDQPLFARCLCPTNTKEENTTYSWERSGSKARWFGGWQQGSFVLPK